MQNNSVAPKERSGVSWLVTFLVVAGLALIITAISVPNLLRSRIAANESSAVGSIRSINTAAATYSSQHPQGSFPQQLSDLAPYVDASLAAGQRSGYSFEYRPLDKDGDGVAEAFAVNAKPVVAGESGQRRFSSNETGAISFQTSASQPKVLLEGGTPKQPERRTASRPRLVVRTGSVSLIVAEPGTAAEKIRALASHLGGYVESVRLSEKGGGGREEAALTLRVPADRYDEARVAVRALAERVQNEEDDARDVTGQYVDFESNLRNFHAEEAQYLEIMRRSGSMKDTLAVAESLADVRGRIERTQGQLNLLAHQTQMASLAVTLRTEAVVQPADVRWQPRAEIRAAFWNAADDLSIYANFMIAVLFRLPVFALWTVTVLVVGLPGWRLLRWLWKRLLPAVAA